MHACAAEKYIDYKHSLVSLLLVLKNQCHLSLFLIPRGHMLPQHKRHMTSYYYLVSLPALKISEFPRIMQSYFENYYYRKQFSNFNAHQSHLEDFLEGRLLGTSSRLPDSVGLW